MVCAMHRLFQSEEDDLIMEGKMKPTERSEDKSNQKQSLSLKGKLRNQLFKSLEKKLKLR